MTTTNMPNRLFIKLLLGFWLCSSLIIACVGLLPLLQQQHDTRPIPYQLERMLNKVSQRVQQKPHLMTNDNLQRWFKRRDSKGRKARFYLVNAQGTVLNNHKAPKQLRRFVFMTEDTDKVISHQFRDDLYFGPQKFTVNGEEYQLIGHLPNHHPRPWFQFLFEHKGLTLSLAILLSGILCGLLAWHLGKPLNSLKRSANALAKGDLSSRVDTTTTRRNDELGQLGNTFNQMAEAIETTVNNQKRLMGDISHELRTPLTRLQLALALMRKKGLDSAETERIGYEAEQLDKLIGELLELSRVQMQTSGNKIPLQLSETLSQVLDDAEFEAEQQEKQLDISIDDGLSLPQHPRLLARAIENLLRNAIYYADSEVYISAQQTQQQTLITIRDDGKGVDEAELEAIFKPFYRPQQARDRQSGGWGLGLAITHAAISAHQGEITASNRQPHGLEIAISLPS